MTTYNSDIFKSIAVVVTMAMLFSCQDGYKRVGDEAIKRIVPQGIAKDFVLTYTEIPKKITSEDTGSTRVMAILSGPVRKDFENLNFPHQTFPEGLLLEIFNEKDELHTFEFDHDWVGPLVVVV